MVTEAHTSQILFVKTFLWSSDFVRARWPETAAVRGQDLIYQHDFISDLVQTEFKLGVCDDNPAGEGIRSRLRAVMVVR